MANLLRRKVLGFLGIATASAQQIQKIAGNKPVCPNCNEPENDLPGKYLVLSDSDSALTPVAVPGLRVVVCKRCSILFSVTD